MSLSSRCLYLMLVGVMRAAVTSLTDRRVTQVWFPSPSLCLLNISQLYIALFYFCFRAAASNVAMKILSPKLDRLSYRFSKAIHLGIYRSMIYIYLYLVGAYTFSPVKKSLLVYPQTLWCLVLLAALSSSMMAPLFCPELLLPKSVPILLELPLMFLRLGVKSQKCSLVCQVIIMHNSLFVLNFLQWYQSFDWLPSGWREDRRNPGGYHEIPSSGSENWQVDQNETSPEGGKRNNSFKYCNSTEIGLAPYLEFCIPMSAHSWKNGELFLRVSLWPLCMSSSLDKKLDLPTLTKTLLTGQLRYVFSVNHCS